MPWADAVALMWGTYMMAWTSEGQAAALFMTIDHHSAAITGS
jgi:hypothetical protein